MVLTNWILQIKLNVDTCSSSQTWKLNIIIFFSQEKENASLVSRAQINNKFAPTIFLPREQIL